MIKKTLIEQLIEKCSFEPSVDVSCTLTARLILEEARRLGFDGKIIDFDDVDDSGHVFVILDGMKNDNKPLNRPSHLQPNVGEVLAEGEDVTNEIMSRPYSQIIG